MRKSISNEDMNKNMKISDYIIIAILRVITDHPYKLLSLISLLGFFAFIHWHHIIHP